MSTHETDFNCDFIAERIVQNGRLIKFIDVVNNCDHNCETRMHARTGAQINTHIHLPNYCLITAGKLHL